MTVSNGTSGSGETAISVSSPVQPSVSVGKRKRSLPGMPDPDAEVIALSPRTLMATNRFVCEICNKGFQRDQNLQLHRRGHNLPWKLRQRSSEEIRKRVYVCPEPSCVHHDPLRALGDLTGIKKHFCRKHGEKKWKCEKCSKKYAVQSDWKAHSKTCGTREYRCDCGTLFSRRDSFVTHRAFCDALAEESAKTQTVANSISDEEQKLKIIDPAASPSATVHAVLPIQRIGSETPTGVLQNSTSTHSVVDGGNNESVFSSVLETSIAGTFQPQTSGFTNVMCTSTQSEIATQPTPLCLSSSSSSSLFAAQEPILQFPPAIPVHMSATALLQKAAQMGARSTGSSFLQGLGLSLPSSSASQEGLQLWGPDTSAMGLGLSLPYESSTVLPDLVMDSSFFVTKPATLDFLGLGMGIGAAAGAVTPSGLSVLMNSMGGGGLNAAFGDDSPRRSLEATESTPSNPALL